MSAENFEKRQRPIPEGLNPEEIKVLQEINNILDIYTQNIHNKTVSVEKMNEKQRTIINFKNELEANNINPYEYYLWHRLTGSSEIKSKLDLDDHTIENKIKEIYAEYI